MTAGKVSNKNMEFLHAQCKQVAEHIDEIVIITDKQGIIIYVNPAFEYYTLFTSAEALGQSVNILNSQIHDKDFFSKMWITITAGKVFRDIFINKNQQGHIYYENKQIRPLMYDGGEIAGYLSIGKYIGDEIEIRIEPDTPCINSKNIDGKNRILLVDRLYQSITRAKWNDRHIAIASLDIDNFKLINEAFGYTVGDQILQDIATRLKNTVRSRDTITHCYGDEFLIVLQDISTTGDMLYITRKIQKTFDSPYKVDDQEFYLTSSMGISVYPEDGKTPDLLINCANTALYTAKQQGKNNQQFYTDCYQEHAFTRITLNTCLHQALCKNEFSIHYQPQISPKSNKLTNVEALLRWNSPEHGEISPDQFIPLLEESGLITEVGEWALNEACEQVRKWQVELQTNLDLSVNISARQFECGNLYNIVSNALQSTGLPPNSLELEVTESTLLKNNDKSLETLSKLSQMGIRLAIDDFGSGYSSFIYLKRFSVDTIKLDKIFIDGIDQNNTDKAVAVSMVNMAQQIGLRVVAEGVENASQLQILKNINCDLVQGFFYSEPVPAKKIEHYIKTRHFENDLQQGIR